MPAFYCRIKIDEGTDEAFARVYLKQLLAGVAFCHVHGVCHRTWSPSAPAGVTCLVLCLQIFACSLLYVAVVRGWWRLDLGGGSGGKGGGVHQVLASPYPGFLSFGAPCAAPAGDLKPENLLLADTPQGLILKIADFGLSALLTGVDEADEDGKPSLCVSRGSCELLSLASFCPVVTLACFLHAFFSSQAFLEPGRRQWSWQRLAGTPWWIDPPAFSSPPKETAQRGGLPTLRCT